MQQASRHQDLSKMARPRALESLTRAVDQRLNLGRCDSEDDRDLVIGEPFKVPENEGRPVHGRQSF
jgi:hypothetical protein